MSVKLSVPAGAMLVCYVPVGPIIDFDNEIIYPLRAALKRAMPSLTRDDANLAEGQDVIVSNGHAAIGVSEGETLVAVWVKPHGGGYDKAWVASIEKLFLKTVVDTLGSAFREVAEA